MVIMKLTTEVGKQMPYFLNSIASINQFTRTTKEKYFVDKSGLITKMTELIWADSQYVCITRPRRFRKTLNAMMLWSYTKVV